MHELATSWIREQHAALDAGWARVLEVVERLGPKGLERPLTPKWTVKEMLAHLAFWEETGQPVIRTIYRGGPEVPAAEWYGGTSLELAPGDPWPDADTHNAREARWARNRSAVEVMERFARARQNLKALLATVTVEESRGPIGEAWSAAAVNEHVDHHLSQVRALGEKSTP